MKKNEFCYGNADTVDDDIGLFNACLSGWHILTDPNVSIQLQAQGGDRGQMLDEHKVGGAKGTMLAMPREKI